MGAPRPRLTGRSIALACVAGVSGCSLFVGLDGLSDGAATDGGTASDVSTNDASSSGGDAASDAAATTDGAAFSCTITPDPIFCDDFERNNVIGPWTDDMQTNGTVAIDTTTATSGTHSLRCKNPIGTDANADVEAWIHHATFSETVSDIQLDFDFNLAMAIDQNQVDLLRLNLHTPTDPASGSLTIAITVEPNNIFLGENDYRVVPTVYTDHPFTRLPKFGTWEHLTLHLTLKGTPHITATLGTDTVVDVDFGSPSVVPALPDLIMGLFHSYQPGAERQLNLDSVLLQGR